MKLFITNKKDFEVHFDPKECGCISECARDCLNAKEIHIKVFQKLSISLEKDYCIPLIIFQNYNDGEGVAIFEFVTKKSDVYFYEFTGTAS
jgi:hypothetical protein